MWIDRGDCRLCIVSSRTGDLVRLGRPDRFPQLLKELATLVELESRSEAFSRSFAVVAEAVGVRDPYRDYKARLAEVGRRVAAAVRRRLAEGGWDLREALRVAAAANIVDTSVLGYRPKRLEDAVWDPPAIEEVVDLPPRLFYVLDNAGEAQVDMVVAEAMERNGIRPTFVVRSSPYEIDVLREDLELTYEVVQTPGNVSPIRWLDGGFVVAKGIANFEAYLEWGRTPALLLFRAKCDVLARLFAVPRNSPIIIGGDSAVKLGRPAA